MPDDKIRAYDIGVTVSYPFATIHSSVPVPTSPGVPGGVYTPTGEGKVSDGDFSITIPTLRLSLVPGSLQTTKQDSRNALVRYGIFGEVTGFDFRQTATTQIGTPTTSQLRADGLMIVGGAYFQSAYLLSDFTEKGSIPPAVSFVRLDILLGIGAAPLTTRVIQPSGGEEKADVLPLLFDSTFRVGVISVNAGPMSFVLASETKVSLQTTQLKNGGTRGSFGYISTAVAGSIEGKF